MLIYLLDHTQNDSITLTPSPKDFLHCSLMQNKSNNFATATDMQVASNHMLCH